MHILGVSVALFSAQDGWKNGTGLRSWPVVASLVRGAQLRQSNNRWFESQQRKEEKEEKPKILPFPFNFYFLQFFRCRCYSYRKKVFCKINYFKLLGIILFISMSDLYFPRPGAVEEWFGHSS